MIKSFVGETGWSRRWASETIYCEASIFFIFYLSSFYICDRTCVQASHFYLTMGIAVPGCAPGCAPDGSCVGTGKGKLILILHIAVFLPLCTCGHESLVISQLSSFTKQVIMWSCEGSCTLLDFTASVIALPTLQIMAIAHKLPISALVFASYKVVVPRRSMWIS